MEEGDDDSLKFSWTSDEQEEAGDPPVDSKLIVVHSGREIVANFEEGCSSSGPSSLLFKRFVSMGFSEEIITRAIEENQEGDEEAILNTILTFEELQNFPDGCGLAGTSLQEEKDADQCLELVVYDSGCGGAGTSFQEEKDADQCREVVAYDSDFWSSDYGENMEGDSLSDFSDSDICNGLEITSSFSSETKQKLIFLEDMNFPKEEALIAMERCGADASVEELANFIMAAQMARADDPYYLESPTRENRNFSFLGKRKRKLADRKRALTETEEMIRLPNPMVGFGVPTMSSSIVQSRKLPKEVVGHPYFFFENVALAPKGVWDTISRHLYNVEPEFIDSKYFCAAARKRGYIHNLPITNRFTLVPPPRLTIQEALPSSKRWWPKWDHRTKLNCLQTVLGSAQLTERIRKALMDYDGVGDPPQHVQKFVMEQCRKWNLIWVGSNRVAPLEPNEVEMLLGFPLNHTRGGGMSRTERYKSLGNSFQVDTVAYLLSPLKEMFPEGLNLLSLFTGIGGAEVALNRLGVPLKNAVSVEISEANRNIMSSWWEQSKQKGTLRHINDVEELTFDKLTELTRLVGGFDLVIGGSPCNNLTGSNRCTRDGLEGKDSRLFFEYVRIVEQVRQLSQHQI